MLTSIEKKEAVVLADEKKIAAMRAAYSKEFTVYAKQLENRLKSNRAATKKIVTTANKKKAQYQKQLTAHTRKIFAVHVSIEKALQKIDKKTHTSCSSFIEEHDTLMASMTEYEIKTLAAYRMHYRSEQKDVQVSTRILKDHLTRINTLTVMGKQRITQLKILLSNKKKHADIANTVATPEDVESEI